MVIHEHIFHKVITTNQRKNLRPSVVQSQPTTGEHRLELQPWRHVRGWWPVIAAADKTWCFYYGQDESKRARCTAFGSTATCGLARRWGLAPFFICQASLAPLAASCSGRRERLAVSSKNQDKIQGKYVESLNLVSHLGDNVWKISFSNPRGRSDFW